MLFDFLAEVVKQKATEKQAVIKNHFTTQFTNGNANTATIINKLETIINKLESDSTISLISKIKAYNTNCNNENKNNILDIFNIKSEYDKRDIPESKDDRNIKQIILENNFSEILSNSNQDSEHNNIVDTVKICYFFTILKIEKEKNKETNLLKTKLNNLIGSDDKLSILDFEVFRDYVNKNVYEYILKLTFVEEIIEGLFMYLTNPFNVLVSIINFPEKERNGKINYPQSNTTIDKDLTCKSNSATYCEIENETLELPTIDNSSNNEIVTKNKLQYGPFDRIFLPPKEKEGIKDYANENLKDSAYIESILNQFFNTNNEDKNYMIMHYGFSGTGKTTQEDKIREKIETMWKLNITKPKPIPASTTTNIFGKNKKVVGIYGKRGTINNGNLYIDTFDDSTVKSRTNWISGEIKENSSRRPERIYKYGYIFKILSEDEIQSNNVHSESNSFLNNSELFKKTLNNDKSSRFHKCTKYTNPNNRSTLWYYDLAGFENPISIVRSVYVNADEQKLNTELGQTSLLKDFYSSLYTDDLFKSVKEPTQKTQVPNIMSYINNQLIKEELKKEKRKEIEELETISEEKPIQPENTKKIKQIKEELNNLPLAEIKKKTRDRIDVLLESYFIMFSLNQLKETLNEYKNNYQIPSYKVDLNLFGIDKPTKFEKIVMFGFINNDKGYKDKEMDRTFLKGTIKTLDFLHNLVQNDTTCPKKETTGATNGGTIESPRHLLTEPTPFQPKQLLLESANKVTESALEPLIVGGGIIDKTVKDTDRSIVIMVTFFITFLSTYMKNTLSDKGVLKNKTEEMVTLVAFYSFFTLLFASLIELGSVDTMYMITYLLAFGIIYITLNTYQEPKKRSLIKDRIEGEVIQEYKEMDSNLLISWMMSSIGVIFV